MDSQTLINILIGVVGFCGAWWVNTLWGITKSQQEQLTALNIKLAEHYPTRSEMEKILNRILDSMDEMKKEITHISRNQGHVKALSEMMGRDDK